MLDLSKISQQLVEMTLAKKQEIQQIKERERNLFEAVDRFCKDPQAYIEKIDSDTHHFLWLFLKTGRMPPFPFRSRFLLIPL